MAFTGQLGTADSQLGNVQLGALGGAGFVLFAATGLAQSTGEVTFSVPGRFAAEGNSQSFGEVTFLRVHALSASGASQSFGEVTWEAFYRFVTLTEVLAGMSTSLREATPTQPDPQSLLARLDGTAANRVRVLLDVERRVPIGVGAQVLKALLLIYPSEVWTGAHTITVEAIDDPWDAASATWNTQPAVRAGAITKAVNAPAADQPISIDITSLVAASVAADDATATRWYGLRLSIDTAGERRFHSAIATPDFRPRMQVEWSEPPNPPEDLLPNSGRYVSKTKPELVGRHFDPDSEDTLSGIHVQIDDADTFEVVLYDSGELDASTARFDLAAPPTGAPATPNLPVDIDLWHRMRTRDNHGVWSEWSSPARFRVHAKGVLTLTGAMAVEPSPTPTTRWNFTGTQVQIEFEIEKRIGGVWESHYLVPKHVGVEVENTVPNDFRLAEGISYRRAVRVWDNFLREDMAGDRAFVEVTQEFTLAPVTV